MLSYRYRIFFYSSGTKKNDAITDHGFTMKYQYLLEIKEARQIIIATYNPNIPTLGDVDLLYHFDW